MNRKYVKNVTERFQAFTKIETFEIMRKLKRKIIGGGERTMGYDRMEKQILLAKIQEKREEMFFIGNKHGLNAEETVTCSRELDQLLNEYYRNFQTGTASKKAGHARKKSFVLFSKPFRQNHIRSS